MTTLQPNERRLARRAVACKGWRWRRGMVAICDNGWRVLRGTDTWEWDAHGSWPGGPPHAEFAAALQRELLPAFNDPATLGCLLALVRAEWQDPGLYCEGMYVPGGAGITTHFRVRGSYHHGATFRRAAEPWRTSEGAALVAMLEAAGRQP